MVDAHCHLNFHVFEKDYDEVIKRALQKGVSKIINVGTSIESSISAVKLSQKYDNLYAIVGIHPHHADKVSDDYIKELRKLAKNKKVLAIGEIGLDYYSYKSNGIVKPKIQKQVFEAQIKLANELKLPLQIHNRWAGVDVIKILEKNKHLLQKNPGMFHCFAGSLEVLENALKLGFYIGFDGNITYKGIAKGENVTLSTLCENTPLNRIIVETDSPFLTPEPFRGGRNEPSYAIIVGEFIAKIKGTSFEEIDKITTLNTHKIFKL